MPTTFVFVRHAEGKHNLDFDNRGYIAYNDPKNIDAELTDYGIIQSITNNIRNETFDKIYCSPMRRCRQTLLNIYPISKVLPVVIDDRLIEQPQGLKICDKRLEKYEIMNTIPAIWNTDKLSVINPFILSKSVDEYKIESFTNDIKKNHPKGKILIVTHGMWINTWLLKYTYSSKYINNCEIIRVIL
jgi:broad specificity phosphatase PhoE